MTELEQYLSQSTLQCICTEKTFLLPVLVKRNHNNSLKYNKILNTGTWDKSFDIINGRLVFQI